MSQPVREHGIEGTAHSSSPASAAQRKSGGGGAGGLDGGGDGGGGEGGGGWAGGEEGGGGADGGEHWGNDNAVFPNCTARPSLPMDGSISVMSRMVKSICEREEKESIADWSRCCSVSGLDESGLLAPAPHRPPLSVACRVPLLSSSCEETSTVVVDASISESNPLTSTCSATARA